jgi:predicted ATPase/transcriptional regulator with XRE-family HTH domain
MVYPNRVLSYCLVWPARAYFGCVMKCFGQALRTYRRAAGLTQEELAERAGVSPRSISGLERGEGVTPRRDTVTLLGTALGLSATDQQTLESMIVRIRGPRGLDVAPAVAEPARPNVPRSLNSFVGRDADMAELGSLISRAPLVTLVGAGGVGKTRLAQELAQEHTGSFSDGAWLVELGEVFEAQRLTGAIASALGLREQHLVTVEHLVEHLRTRQLLLVIDNCEHLVGACAELVDTLLRACPRLHVVATSREPLAVAGEIIWVVRPLDMLTGRRLFMDRAAAAQGGFELTDENASAIERLCSALDGIPLALEHAAARTRLLSVEQLADRLEYDPHVLRGSDRSGPPRHRTLAASVDWSYELLSAQEQVLLGCLSMFGDGWTFETAEAACTGPGFDAEDLLRVLGQLVDKSMVTVDTRHTAARYRLLQPIRKYAQAREVASCPPRTPALSVEWPACDRAPSVRSHRG